MKPTNDILPEGEGVTDLLTQQSVSAKIVYWGLIVLYIVLVAYILFLIGLTLCYA